MNLPPFPSQDLAKLVLGYLAEEQLMTAYDEFLQASPYLDALRNEYDRIFMTSLKSILAEYRAVKICVETCKPFILRKRLFQCHNLLEVVRFLINHVDINKLQLLEAAEKASYEKQNTSTKPNTCDVCNSQKLPTCMCKSRQSDSSVSQCYNEASVSQNSTEATPLTDLPGNYVTTRKKQVKTIEKESTLSNSNVSSAQHSDCSTKDSHSSTSTEQSVTQHQSHHSRSNEVTAPGLSSTVKPAEMLDSRQKLEEFNDVLKSVVKRNSTISGSEVISDKIVSNANTFKEFASGVTGGDSHSANVPDSSTSEYMNVQSNTKDYYNDNKGPTKCQLMLQVSQVNDGIDIKTYRAATKQPKLLPKTDEQKIKILSDVKVANQGEKNKGGKKKPTILKNATSTPLMQMQTIVINGTPAYKNNTLSSHTYTKDEIMAMPTLIVVPPTGSSKSHKSSQIKPVTSESCNIISNDISSPSRVLGPLVIDVPHSPKQCPTPSAVRLPDLNNRNPSGTNLVKTVDVFKNASVPKDTGTTTTVVTNTPQGMLPLRKSSSTPRRTSSHVRVLDFTTPRRILHETINEQGGTETAPAPVEIVLSSSPNLTQTLTTTSSVTTTETTLIDYNSSSVQNVKCIEINESIKNVSIVKPKPKCDWDADLRALVASDEPVSKPKPETRKKERKERKQKPDKLSESNKEKKTRKHNSPKCKKNKKRRKVIEIDDDPPPDDNIKPSAPPVNPTINVISAHTNDKEADAPTTHINDNNVHKSNEKEDDLTNTPDAERLLLQNVIGAKLNISELLETPYKQALYDIQMETPRFLGPDLPDDPMSDIKIMNIPTPRFLNTPKVVQATPSSYSSRPTDYSSGGSYYKPDEQDYFVIPDLTCPVTSSKDTNDNNDENENAIKKSRPVRQCTKNVSYYSSSGAVRAKNVDDNSDTSSSSEMIDGNCSITDSKNEKDIVKTPSNNKSKTRVLTESNKKSTIKTRKPQKEKPKTFIKIKPRQTPTKLTPAGKMRRKTSDNSKYTSPNKLARKRTSSKEKILNIQPLVVCAPTKSRRKSSTPRKIHCTKTYNSGNFRMNYPDNKPDISANSAKSDKQDGHISSLEQQGVPRDTMSSHDSDTEQLALRWSDDGSQDAKAKELQSNVSANGSEDISQIKQYIETTNIVNKPTLRKDGDVSLQADLIKRGFDVETAKIIERELLDTPAQSERPPQLSVEIVETKESSLEKTIETDASCNNELQIVQDENEDEDSVEFSVHECNEDTNNYFTYEYDATKEITPTEGVTLKDNFSMEICIDDLTVRLRANQFTTLVDQHPVTVGEVDYNTKEIEMAVNSIYNMDRLYTPLKQSVKAQCIEIFDSTLTSIDTPLKSGSPNKGDNDATVTEIVLEEEKSESKDKSDAKKRKRSVPDDTIVDNKKPKHDTQYLLASTNIQNIDIESVLKKLHGP